MPYILYSIILYNIIYTCHSHMEQEYNIQQCIRTQWSYSVVHDGSVLNSLIKAKYIHMYICHGRYREGYDNEHSHILFTLSIHIHLQGTQEITET